MVNPERTMLMTRAEMIRGKEERRALKINRYTRFDYVTFSMLLSGIVFLFGCMVILTMLFVFFMDELLTQMSFGELRHIGMVAGISCLVLLLVFLVINGFVAAYRYRRADEEVKQYQLLLKRINHISEQEAQKLWRESGEYHV